MKTPENTEWVTELDRAYGLVHAARTTESKRGADAEMQRALFVLAKLHGRMLRAEVRSVFSGRRLRRGRESWRRACR